MRDPSEFPLDDNGQPPEVLNSSWRRERSVDELLGFLRGILVDGPLTERKVIALARMVNERAEDLSFSMFGELAGDLAEAIDDDGRICAASLATVETRVRQILGMPHEDVVTAYSSALPLTAPVPQIIIPGRTFCFTGKLALGARKTCEALVAERGGRALETVTAETDYLVIGSLASRDWIHSAYGRKIERALELGQSYPVAIISEETFINGLQNKAREG